MNNKKDEFVSRLSEKLKRFVIQDKFSQIGSNVARPAIARMAYDTLEEIARETTQTTPETESLESVSGETESLESVSPATPAEKAAATYEEIQKAGEETCT